MKIKVCGMKFAENIHAISELNPDYMGFIFYDKSPRFALQELDEKQMVNLPTTITKVGVFVDEEHENVLQICHDFNIENVQLHGSESPAFCLKLKEAGLKVIKAFGVDEAFNFKELEIYSFACDFFLFDTKTSKHGGSGKKFDWQVLNQYQQNTPFFLSGGVSIEDLDEIRSLNLQKLHAIDINSRFEIKARLKDPELVKILIKSIRDEI
jgi:phosphoribosylanthranilate isomerase